MTLQVGFKGFITALTGELYVPERGRVVFLDTGRARYTLRLGDVHDVVPT
ncbi:MAG TPA: hypothetical protein VHT97_07900 [Acidimicrobiales bacterium]|nr:hypothetical protein [Acidimicrobiales bacterium]